MIVVNTRWQILGSRYVIILVGWIYEQLFFDGEKNWRRFGAGIVKIWWNVTSD